MATITEKALSIVVLVLLACMAVMVATGNHSHGNGNTLGSTQASQLEEKSKPDQPATCERQPYNNLPCASMCTTVCVEQEALCYPKCYATCNEKQRAVRPGALGDWIMMNAIQHVGITTSNLSRSIAFYTEV